MGKTYLITGAAGFIGSNLAHYIRSKEPESIIISYDKLTYAGNRVNLKDLENDTLHHFVHGDICDGSLLQKTLNHYTPHAIFHLAAETHVDRSIVDSYDFIQTNVVGQKTILDASLQYYKDMQSHAQKDFRFIHISTDEVFGELNANDPKFSESTPYAPRSPYSASKAASDHLTRAWFNTYGLPTIILNCSNNYGPHQYPEKLIPLMIQNALNEVPLPVYGDGQQIRDWLYVEDHCNAIYTAANHGQIGETYCVGGNNEIKNIDVITIICEHLDTIRPRSNNTSYKDLICFVSDRPGHDYRYAIDSRKIQTELGWYAGTDFADGLRRTIHWYLDNGDWCQLIEHRQEIAND